MKRISSALFVGIGTYCLTWTLAYLAIMGSDFRYYLEYLRLAWTSPGEIPTFLQAVSLVVTLIVSISFYVWRGRRKI